LRNRNGVLEMIVAAAAEHTPLPSPPPHGGREPAGARGERARGSGGAHP
jgi:hypothetical protein